MAAQSAIFYATKKNNWRLSEETLITPGAVERHMDNPTMDCQGRPAEDNCSIDNIEDYKDGMNTHYAAGVFNKAFILLVIH